MENDFSFFLVSNNFNGNVLSDTALIMFILNIPNYHIGYNDNYKVGYYIEHDSNYFSIKVMKYDLESNGLSLLTFIEKNYIDQNKCYLIDGTSFNENWEQVLINICKINKISIIKSVYNGVDGYDNFWLLKV